MTTPATSTGTQVYSVYIRATPERVWDAITQPAWTERYGYFVRSEFDLRPGGAFRGLANDGMRAMGAPEVAVDGEVLEADPPRRLVQTWRMLMDPGVAAEGFTRLTYEIDDKGDGVTKLTVTHELGDARTLSMMVSGAFEDQAPGGGGWNWVLSGIKTLLETGEVLPIPGLPSQA
ncbi:MAG TPA: SRPBCC family protein [Thermomicrobiaceae bacterium]|nr:SRPBCC family protein [Thermomicrobiaceae bacterium]